MLGRRVGGGLAVLQRLANGAATVQCRFAGGGGRPGGRPAFNWKEKQVLRLSNKANKKKAFKLKDFGEGEWGDLEALLDKSRGDYVKNITALGEFKLPPPKSSSDEQPEEEENTRKQIQVRALFGSHKGFGPVPIKTNFQRKTFSHRALAEKRKAAKRI